MKKFRLCLLVLLGLLFIAGCNIPFFDNTDGTKDNNEENNDNKNEETMVSYLKPDFSTPLHTSKLQFTYNDLFNVGNKVDIKVNISENELKLLQADYETGKKGEIYRRADNVTITIRNNNKDFIWSFDNVGIRQKGNTSRRSIFNDGDPTKLNLNHYKLSFDETFTNSLMYSSSYISTYGNDLYATRDFLGLSGIDIKWNKNYDMTHVKEIYSQSMYNAFGIISQKAGLATFKLNNLDYGIVTIYQKASKSLIRESLKNGNILNMSSWDDEKTGTQGIALEKYGDLYKCSYGVGDGSSWSGADLTNDSIKDRRIGVSDISGNYIPAYDRKTAVNITYDDYRLKNMVNTINSSSYSEIEKLVDLEYFAMYQAVGFYVGNPDDIRYNFNNYMIYIRRTDGKAVFIPIDQDRCFGIVQDWNVMDGLMYVGVFDKTCSNNQDQRNKLILKTILSKNTECSKNYLSNLKLISESEWVNTSTFDSLYQKAKATYANYGFSPTDNNYSFSTYINNKQNAVKNALNVN